MKISQSLTRPLALVALSAAMFLGAAAIPQFAEAQPSSNNKNKQKEPPSPPRPNKADDPSVLIQYLLAVVIGAAVVFAGVIPSKRGHQD
jgi:hypothetical protein